jgi:hypothetical protein
MDFGTGGMQMVRWSTTPVIMLAAWLAMSAFAEAQIQLEANYLLLKRQDSASGSLVTGPQGLSTSDDYDYASGYRFGIVGGYDWAEVEVLFSQVDDWSSNQNRILGAGLALDDSAANPFVFPGGTANALAFRNALFDAATAPGAVGADETLEGELLQPGAIARLRQSSRYRDFELNFGTNRTTNWWRFGLGWRNIQLNDRNQFAFLGTFDAIDVDDGAVAGGAGNDQNDALSDAALTAAGFTLTGGAADGFDAADVVGAGPDTLTIFNGASADNELNGLQAIAAAQVAQTEYFVLEVVGKAGVYHNRVHANVNEILVGSGNDDSVYQRTFADQQSTASFVGSLGLQARIPVTDYITFTTGYEGVVLTGVALGSQQFQGVHQNLLGTTVFSARADDSTLLHGAKFGLELTF